MIKSRLRRPTSKSMTTVLWPRIASAEEKLALVVVLPTPPLPEVTTTIRAMTAEFLIGFVNHVIVKHNHRNIAQSGAVRYLTSQKKITSANSPEPQREAHSL